MARDYAHDVEQIRTALHQAAGSRASLMVGAGFSFNAQKRYASARDFPSWSSLAESLVLRLYPNDPGARGRALKNAGATSGALRLAQEFEAAFGRTVLLNHLRDMLPDREHEPGAFHQDLLNLPWSDVFTTNYDTLLERAARPLREQRYEVVRGLNDLPLKRSPRIVKLHGTLPELSDCIVTEEDYRTYPEKFGPFVAEVEVAIAESHLCLVGFSGDDPNFLAWSGWVRDRLGDKTPPIYLWTFDELTTFQARMLEQRSVIPLPLSVVTGKADYAEALRAFLHLLKAPGVRKPRWCLPRNLKDEVVDTEPESPGDSESWVTAALAWRKNREFYPEWMVPHVEAIEALWKATETWAGRAADNPPELSALDAPTCIFVLHELLWRIRRAIFPTYDGLAIYTCTDALQRYATWRKDQRSSRVEIGHGAVKTDVDMVALDHGAMELQLERLRHARETGDFNRFESLLADLERELDTKPKERQGPARHFLKHQTALAYLSTWDDTKLNELLFGWDTSFAPLWALRRAGLLVETGERRLGESVLEQALNELRAMADEGTSETWSIESWVIFGLRAIRRLEQLISPQPIDFQGPRTDVNPHLKVRSVADEREDSDAYRLPESQVPRLEETLDKGKKRELQGTLNWLRDRSCDPQEILEWLDQQNSREFTWAWTTARVKKFDRRAWTKNIRMDVSGSNSRLVAAYRTLRLIEEAGLPLWVGDIQPAAASLSKDAIRFLAERDVPDVTGTVLRTRTENSIAEWYTRRRIATLASTDVDRLRSIAETCLRRVAEAPDVLARDADETRKFAATVELLSRASLRAGDASLQDLLRFTMTLPTKLQIWERWWLVEGLNTLTRRICDGMSHSAAIEMLPAVLRSAVPGSPSFPSPPDFLRWVDPVEMLDRDESLTTAQRSAAAAKAIESIIGRLLEIADDKNHQSERRHLVLRLVTIANRGLLDSAQQEGFAKALFTSRDSTTGLPIDTGCLDSVVLLAPPVAGVDEHGLFNAKYVATPWPTDTQPLCSLLGSLARTGPIVKLRPGGRAREIDWSTGELREIAARCCSTMEEQAKVVLSADGRPGRLSSASEDFSKSG